MSNHAGGCHCGNIRYEYSTPDQPALWPVRRCTCTYCARHGARYTSGPAARLAVTVLYASMAQTYEFGTKTAGFLRCGRCGVMVMASANAGGRRIGVLNVNTLDNAERLPLHVTDTDFDGEALAARLERRNTNWIQNVTLDFVNA